MPHTIRRILLAAAYAAQLTLAVGGARGYADEACDVRDYEGESDHDKARRALECGEVLPLEEVLAAVQSHMDGRVIETEFEREGEVWIYELKYIDQQGRFVEVDVNARSGEILKVKGAE